MHTLVRQNNKNNQYGMTNMTSEVCRLQAKENSF